MLKQLFDFVQQLLLLVRDTQRNRDDIEELRQRLHEINAFVIDLAHKVKRLSEREQHEREKFTLKVENALLRFERQLPPPKPGKPSKL